MKKSYKFVFALFLFLLIFRWAFFNWSAITSFLNNFGAGFFQSIKSISTTTTNITTDQVALLIAIFALALQLVTLLIYRTEINIYKSQLNILQKQYRDSLDSIRRRKMEIVVMEAKKHEHVDQKQDDRPLKWIGIWLQVNNRSDEQIFFKTLHVELHFKPVRHLEDKVDNWLLKPIAWYARKFQPIRSYVSFDLYGPNTTHRALPSPSIFQYPDHFYLIDWETKQPVYFAPQKEYRGPLPGQKQQLYLFGDLPEEMTKIYSKEGYYLDSARLIFVTDINEIEVFARFGRIHEIISSDDLVELVNHKFQFEKTGWTLKYFSPAWDDD